MSTSALRELDETARNGISRADLQTVKEEEKSESGSQEEAGVSELGRVQPWLLSAGSHRGCTNRFEKKCDSFPIIGSHRGGTNRFEKNAIVSSL